MLPAATGVVIRKLASLHCSIHAGEAQASLRPLAAAADTVWFLSNVLNMLSTMDSAVPYLLTDHIWWVLQVCWRHT